MIPLHAVPAKPQTPDSHSTSPQWKKELAEAISDPAELLQLVGLESDQRLQEAITADKLFRLRVPRSYARRIEYGNPQDPLLLQVLPLGAEYSGMYTGMPGYSSDPVGDMAAQKHPGLLHKYHGRVLLVTTGSCAINCRYCFRREYPYEDASATQSQWQEAVNYISADNSISEVILSGGDPLTLSDKRLDKLISLIEAIPHVKRLRIHSRLPVVLPSRMTETLIKRLQNSRLQAVMVIHSNHAQELDKSVEQSIGLLKQAGIPCLNQAVLLKGINSSLSALNNLSERLFEIGVQPYYLHLLDRVNGAAHFDISEDEAKTLITDLQGKLPGYMVPKLVREIAGQPNKTPI